MGKTNKFHLRRVAGDSGEAIVPDSWLPAFLGDGVIRSSIGYPEEGYSEEETAEIFFGTTAYSEDPEHRTRGMARRWWGHGRI